MVRFNLLPWRQSLSRYQRKQRIQFSIISVCSAMLVSLCLHYYLAMKKNDLTEAVMILNQSWHEKQMKLKSKWEVDSGALTQTFISEQSNVIQQIKDLHEWVTEGSCLAAVHAKEQVKITGMTRSFTIIQSMMNQWRKSHAASSLILQQVQMQKNGVLQFSLILNK